MFSRLLLIAFLVFVQAAFLVILYRSLGATATEIIQASASVVGVLLVIFIVNRDMDPAFKLTWILPMTILPVFGVPLYFAFRSNLGMRRDRARIKKEIMETNRFITRDDELRKTVAETVPEVAHLTRYVENYGYSTVYRNTHATYYSSGEDMFRAMKEEIAAAEKYVFLEFFIIQEGSMWKELLELLLRKIQEGVEVRLLYDDIGSIFKLPGGYEKYLREIGLPTRVFCPVRPVFSTEQNNRDHRKIVVIDGKKAFTGGINIADEYVNIASRVGRWKDAGVLLEGPAARMFTLLFIQNWNTAGKDPSDGVYAKYLDPPEEHTSENNGTGGSDKDPGLDGYCIPLADNPMDNEQIIESVYLDIITRAERYVHIMTPYLIIDSKMAAALTGAAKQGVDVSIILPHIPDKKFCFAVARSHYPELIAGGVKVYEYTPGFVHAKVFVSDDIKAVVGTSNLDFRSLYLHFECAAYLYGSPAVQDAEADFRKTAAESQRMTLGDYEAFPLAERLSGRFFRLFGPFM